MNKHKRGFTLLELMIVVGIIALLAAIAIPAFSRYGYRARRTEGQQLLQHIASAQERYYSTHNKYTDDPDNLGYDGTPTSDKGYYQASLTTKDKDQKYTATAKPQKGQSDDACGNLSIDNTGDKQPDKSDTAANSNGDCW